MWNCPKDDAEHDQRRVRFTNKPKKKKPADSHYTRTQEVGSLSSKPIRNIAGQRDQEDFKHGEQQHGVEQEASIHFQVCGSVRKDEGGENIKWRLFRQSN